MRYVIIGNSAGAVGCVEGIRSVDKSGEITLISSENEHTYSRPLISYLLCGRTDEQRMKYRPDDFYEKNSVCAMLGRTAASIDAAAKTVTLEDGETIEYDKLLAATGSRAFVPKMEGLSKVKKRHTFMSLSDSRALESELTPESRVLIIGAGLIGLKCAEGIAGKCACIDVVDLARRVLPSILDGQGAAMVREHLEASGLRFHLGTSVEKFSQNSAALKNGETIEFDVLVLAVGVRPNIELLSQAGARTDRGVIVDEHCATTLADVWSAGDCTQGYDAATGEKRVLALLPNAYMQGECAGKNMAGKDAVYDKAIAMNAIGFFGLHILTAGSYDGDGYVQSGAHEYKRLFSRGGLLVGCILIGDIRRAGIYTSLIRNKTPLETIDYELIKEKPQLMAFSKAERQKKLGGVKL